MIAAALIASEQSSKKEVPPSSAARPHPLIPRVRKVVPWWNAHSKTTQPQPQGQVVDVDVFGNRLDIIDDDDDRSL